MVAAEAMNGFVDGLIGEGIWWWMGDLKFGLNREL
jgi:hypothetical protein